MPARSNAPYGFKPYKKLLGANWYKIASTGKAIFKHDLVRLSTYGVSRAVAGANKPLLGAALAFVDGSGVPTNYYASGVTGAMVLVADDPNQLFEAQEDCDATCIDYKKVNLNALLVHSSHGDTTTGLSKDEIDSSSLSATKGNHLLVVDEVTTEDSLGTQAALSYKRWVVRIAIHNFAQHAKMGVKGV